MASFGESRLRLRYSKSGRAKYISHLDLMATMKRAFLRAGLELKYSEGFNPHPYISVALPLSVGCSSICELVDFDVLGAPPAAGISAFVNAALPEGIEVLEAYRPSRKFGDIAWAELSGRLVYGAGAAISAAERLEGHFAAKALVVPKKTKRGTSDIDIAPFIRDISVSAARGGGDDGDGGDGGGGDCADGAGGDVSGAAARGGEAAVGEAVINLNLKVSAQDPSINHLMLLNSLDVAGGALRPDMALFTRVEVFDADMRVFR